MSTETTGGLFVTELGDPDRPRVVFLHGLFGQGKNWTTVAKALATDYRVVLVDLPDHGRSAWTTTFSYAEYAGLIGELVAGWDDGAVALVGHSMGGKTAMALALRRPELVERLVVADISPVRYAGLREFATFVSGMRAIDLDRLESRAEADESLRTAAPDPVVRGFLLQNLRRGPGPDTPTARWHWQMHLSLLGDQLDDIGGWPDDLADGRYPGPVLWLAGERSDYVRPQYAAAMRALFPRAQLVTIKNSGHWLHSEQPEVFVATLRRFLAAGSPPR